MDFVSVACGNMAVENAWKLLSASKKRTFVAVQVSPAVRVSIGESFGLYRGEDGIGKVAAALTALGADAVVDTAVVSDALTLMKLDAVKAGVKPVFSSECTKWVNFARENYPEIAENLLPSATTVCAKLLKKYYQTQMPDKKIRVIALEAGAGKKADPGVDVVLTLDELAQMLNLLGVNIRLMKKQSLETPLGVASGAGYIAAASGGDAEALARCLTKDKTQTNLRKFGYSGLYSHKACREVNLDLDGKTWSFAVVDTLDAASELLAEIQSGAQSYDYVEVTACEGGQIGVGCDLSSEQGEMTRRLRKLGLQYLDIARAARSADCSSSAAAVVKAWNALCRSGEAAALDYIEEIVDDPEEIVEEVVEEIVEDVVEEAVEENVPEEIIEEIVEDVVEEIVDEIVEEIVEEVVEEITEEIHEEITEELVEEIVEEIIEEIVEEVAKEEEAPVEKEVIEAVEEPVEEEVIEAVEEPVEEEVIEAVEEPVEEEVIETVEEPVEEEVIEAVEAPVEEEVIETVEEPVEEEVIEDVEAVFEETIEEITPIIEEEPVEEAIEEVVEEEAVIEEKPIAPKYTQEELEEATQHVEEYLGVADAELTPAQRAARNIYYRRLSSTERRKLKRSRRNQKKH